MTIIKYLPTSAAQWRTALLVLLGGLVGWVTHPAVWVIAGPARWCGILLGTCQAESRYGEYDEGDDGASIGPMQWHTVNAGLVTGQSGDWRTSAYWSGYAAAVYYGRRVMSEPAWALAARLPGVSPIVLRWMYRNSRALSRSLWAEARAQYDSERATWQAVGYPWHPLAVHMWVIAAGLVVAPIALLVASVAWPLAGVAITVSAALAAAYSLSRVVSDA